MKQRGICPVCGVERFVTRAGGMWNHSGDKYVGGWRQVCAGVGQPPALFTQSDMAPTVEAAEARGYQKAIDALRDQGAILAWWQTDGPNPDAYLPVNVVLHLADYLESLLAPAPTVHEGGTASE